MKFIKYFVFYIFIVCFLASLYDSETLIKIIFHYSQIDFRYLIFTMIQFYWVTIFFQIVYQYICMSHCICVRLSKSKTYLFVLKRISIYLLSYVFVHMMIFKFISLQIPCFLLFLNLVILGVASIFAIFLKKTWNYSYIFIISVILCTHFVV